jgi:hypothetical protein
MYASKYIFFEFYKLRNQYDVGREKREKKKDSYWRRVVCVVESDGNTPVGS